MKGDIYVMESKMNEFIKITEGEKVALIDPVGKVCLGVSKRFADNLDKPEFQEKLFPVWEQQTEFVKEIEKNHEKINTVYLMVTRKCNMNCDFCAISANDKLRPEKEFKLEDIQNKVIPFFQKNKPHKMILTGGEPLIKDQIVEIAKALRNGLTCPITLQSNGLAITEELTEQLKGYIDEIDFSTMHMFGTPEKEQQLIKHIEMCQQAGIKVVLTFIYEKTNEMDLYRLIDIAAKYDIDVLFNIVSSVGRAKENSEILTDMEHLDMNLKIVKYILNQGYEDKKIGGAFYQRVQVRNSCGGYGKVMAIFPEGDIYMCYSILSICMTLLIGTPIAMLICRQMSISCYGKVVEYSFPFFYMGIYVLVLLLIQVIENIKDVVWLKRCLDLKKAV